LLCGIPVSRCISLIGSTFVLEYLAVPVGIALGLSPWHALVKVISAGVGIFALALALFEFLGSKAQRVANFLLKLRGRTPRFQRYGIYSLVPGATLLGIYGCAAAAWAFGWGRTPSIGLTGLGFALISTLVLLSTIGALKIIEFW